MVSEDELDDAMATGQITPEDYAAYMDAPTSKEKASIFQFFNKILKAQGEQLSKVSNLHDNEIGNLHELRKGSIYSQVMDLDQVAAFFDAEADAYLALCDSRKGFLITSSITQKRETTAKAGALTEKKKWRLFGGGSQE